MSPGRAAVRRRRPYGRHAAPWLGLDVVNTSDDVGARISDSASTSGAQPPRTHSLAGRWHIGAIGGCVSWG